MKNPLIRTYVMIRAPEGEAGGFARFDARGNHLTMALQLARLPAKCPILRVLLLSGDEDSGAVIDLGRLTPDAMNGANMHADVPLPPASLRSFHTLALAADWPDGTLTLCGSIADGAPYDQRQLQGMVRHYLMVPPTHALCERALPGRAPLTGLQPLCWPDEIAELKHYFDTLAPTAPFDAPGWRFVRVPIEAQQPAPYCNVGIRISGSRITEVAYALPGHEAPQPPEGLAGYQWTQGRHRQGYWLLRRALV